jgi:rubrerythrin
MRHSPAGKALRLRARVTGYVRRNRPEEGTMADPVPAGSDVSAGTYKCTNCGYELQVGSTQNLPPCPSCGNGHYDTQSGGDSVDDPYPDR